jgi:hypothetical protein
MQLLSFVYVLILPDNLDLTIGSRKQTMGEESLSLRQHFRGIF